MHCPKTAKQKTLQIGKEVWAHKKNHKKTFGHKINSLSDFDS